MNKYLEKLAKINPKKTLDLLTGKRLGKAQGFVDKRLSGAIKSKGKDDVEMKKFVNARLHRDRVSAATTKSRKIAGGVAAGTAAVGGAVAYKASKDKK